MSAKTPSNQQPSGLLQWLYERGERTVEDLLSNRAVTDGVTKTIRSAARTKGRVDQNMQMLLSLLNLPSRADYAKLLTKIEVLQGSLVNLNMKLDRLLAATATPPRAPRKRAPAAPVHRERVRESDEG